MLSTEGFFVDWVGNARSILDPGGGYLCEVDLKARYVAITTDSGAVVHEAAEIFFASFKEADVQILASPAAINERFRIAMIWKAREQEIEQTLGPIATRIEAPTGLTQLAGAAAVVSRSRPSRSP